MAATQSSLPTIERFLAWWFAELSSPFGGSRSATGGYSRAILVDVDAGETRFALRSKGRTSALGRLARGRPADPGALRAVSRSARRGVPIVLSLAPEGGIARTLRLPAAAERDLDAVMAFEIGRQTPFPPDQAYYDFDVVGRDGGADRLDVRLAVVPRAAVQPIADELAGWGLRLDGAELALDDGTDVAIPFHGDRDDKARRRGARVRNGTLLGLLLLLLGALVFMYFDGRATLEAALTARVEAAKAEAEAVAKLRDDLVATHEHASFLRVARRDRVPTLAVLDEVSTLLPGDTWLLRFELNGEELTIEGRSPEATKLIALLDGSPLLNEVQFRSPVTRTADGAAEQFHIGARVGREGATP